MECVTLCHGIPHSTASDQASHFPVNEIMQGVCTHGMHWSHHVPHHPQAAGLTEWWNGLLQTQLHYSWVATWCCAVITRIYRSRNEGVETGVTSFTITPSGPLAQFLLPVFVTLCSVGLEVLVPKGWMLLPGDNNSTELEVKTVTWPLWTPCVSESTKQGREWARWLGCQILTSKGKADC